MYKIIITILCLTPTILRAQLENGVKFSDELNWEQVKQKARAEHKNIFIDVFTTWCGPCKKMDKEVYTDQVVGSFVNENFISIKMQMDSTASDLPSVKNFRNFALALNDKYKIEAFPSFLFLSPDGELIDRGVGFKNSVDFLSLAKIAADSNLNYSAQVKQFNKGELMATKLLELALKAKSNKEDSLAKKIALAYKKSFLEGEPPAQILKPETAMLFSEFGEIFNFNDPVVKYLYSRPKDAESKLIIWRGYALAFVDYVITRDYVNSKLWPGGIKISRQPNWKNLERNITNSFDPLTATRIVLNAQIRWYREQEDWQKVVKYEIEKIDALGIDSSGTGAYILNNIVFEIIFKYSNDKSALKKGISYMEKLLEQDPENFSKIDTYANILYKAGFKKKAIENEKQAISLAKEKKELEAVAMLEDTLNKMLNSQPTWTIINQKDE